MVSMAFFLRGVRATHHQRLALPTITRAITTSPIEMTPRIIDAIKQDHREIESYYDRIMESSSKDEQKRYQNQFTWEVARHSIGEELVVYPAFEKYVPDGVKLADKDRQEHQTVSRHTHFTSCETLFLTECT